MFLILRRREFITLLGGVPAWPLAARAQQSAMPVVGFLRSTPAAPFAHLVAALREGLKDAGFVEGQNVAIEQRWADNQPDRLLALAAELVSRRVAVIAGNHQAAEAARAELVPQATVIAILSNPSFSGSVDDEREAREAVRSIGRQVVTVRTASEDELNAAFATIVHAGAGALLVRGGQAIEMALCPAIFDGQILTVDEAGFLEAGQEDGHGCCERFGLSGAEKTDDRPRALRSGHHRPRRHSAAQQRDEFAPFHCPGSSRGSDRQDSIPRYGRTLPRCGISV